FHFPPRGFEVKPVEMRIDQERFVSLRPNLILSKHEFQREMWIATAKVGRAIKIPIGIHQRELHAARPLGLVVAAASLAHGRGPGSACWFYSQNFRRSSIVFSRSISGFQPVCRSSLL